jgi:DNA-directed RNA polymerase specialized sigma24 family protein
MRVCTFDILAMTSVGDRKPRGSVDFASVPPSQWKMHDRLENWRRWARGSQGQSGGGSPMFDLYRSSEARREYGEETTVPVDKEDAIKVAKAVGHLPPKKRAAIHWSYLHPRNPVGKARELGVELHELAQLVKDARTLLISWIG